MAIVLFDFISLIFYVNNNFFVVFFLVFPCIKNVCSPPLQGTEESYFFISIFLIGYYIIGWWSV